MNAWDEKAEDAAHLDSANADTWAPADATRFGGFMQGARWQREALRSDEAVERAARALYRHQVPDGLACAATPWNEAHETQRDHFRSAALTALTAALGGGE